MAEKIGLEAVLQLNSFNQAVRTYNQAISGMSKNTTSTASSISSSFTNLGSGILKVGAIAAGAGLAGIAALTGGLLLLGSTALTEFAKYERMALSIQSLVARELSQGKLVEQQRSVAISLTKKEAQELEGLAGKIHDEELARDTLHARIKEQSEALRQLRDAHGDEALDVQTATARLAQLENQYNKSGNEIQTYKDRQTELSNKTGEYTTVLEKVRTGQMSMAEAMAQAGPRAQELLNWIQLLAIQSPFDSEGIANAFRTALAYGFTTEAAQRLTEAEVDFTAATGQGADATDNIARALGQMQSKGKVSAEELNQLSENGIGTNKILEDMGFTLKDVENGLVPVDDLIEAIIQDMEIFKGAGKASATTFSGLLTSLSELKNIALREFFTGTFTAIQPYLASFVDMLTSATLETGSIRALGDALGTYVAGGIQQIIQFAGQLSEIFSAFQTGGIGGLVAALGITPDAISLIEKFRGMITQIADTIAGPLMAAFGDLSAGGILDSINQSITFLNDHFAELQGALTGIGVVLAGGVFAALLAGLLALLTPMNLIIAGAALLGAAWMGNWFGIRDTLTQVWATIQPILTDLWEWLKTNIPVAIQTLSDIWTNNLLPGFTRIYDAISSQVLPAFQDLINTFTGATGGTQGLSDLWNNTLLPAITAVGDFVLNTLFPAWVDLEVFLAGALATAIRSLADYWENYLFPAMGKVKDAIKVMSDLWTNTLKPALVTVGNYINDNIIPLFESLAELHDAVLNKALEASAGLWKNVLLPAITKVGNFLKDTLNPVFEKISKSVKDDVSPVLKDLGEVVFPLLQEGLDFVTASIEKLIKFFDSLTAKVNGFDLPPILKPGSPPPFAYALIDIAKGAEMAAGAITAMGQATNAISGANLNSLMTGLKVTDSGFIHDFIDDLNIGGFLTEAGALGGGQRRNFRNILKNEIAANMQGLADGTINFMDKITEVANRFGFPPNLAREFAKAEGLVEHLTGTFSVMFQKLRIENMAASIGIANNFSSIGSSFADMIQEQVDAFEKSKEATAKLNEEGSKLSETATTQELQLAKLRTELSKLTTGAGTNALAIEKLTEALAFGERQLEIYNRELALEVPGSIKYDKIKLSIDKLTESMDMQQVQLEKLTAASDIDIISVQKKQEEIAKLTEEMDANSKAIQANQIAIETARQKLMQSVGAEFMTDATDAEKIAGELAKIQLLTEFLAGDQNQLTIASKLQTVYGEVLVEQHLDRVKAQEELNKLTAEQARREQEIIRQREAQAKLDFLGQQINLIKLISDRGLNPRDILGGITLGLQAGATDLLAATNRVVEAMVNQINADLQIASPSKVMARIGGQVIAGMAQGIERGRNMLTDTVRNIPLLNGSIPQPVFSQAGGISSATNNVYNYNFPMTVNTTASASGVIRQYEVKRSMYAN